MNILHIDCSARADSHSRALSAALVAHLSKDMPQVRVTRRDLGLAPIAHASAAYADGLQSPQALQEALAGSAMTLSEQLIVEVEHADVLVIGTPMHNFTVPSVFKAWLDQVLRVGRTIGRTAEGRKTGLLADRPVHVAIAAGGFFSGERPSQPDFLTPYLSAAFACIGLHSVRYLALQGTAVLEPAQLRVEHERLLDSLAEGRARP